MRGEFFDTAELALNAESGHATAWGNFGYWRSAHSYPQAAEALARLLADAVTLSGRNRVLDLGFGMGEQLRLWQQVYGVRELLGFNPSGSQNALARGRIPGSGYQLRQASAESLLGTPAPGRVDAILALDCAYHFRRRKQLFRHLAGCLRPRGVMGWTDLFLPGPASLGRRLALEALCRGSRIPRDNLLSEAGYRQMLGDAGLRVQMFSDLTADVFGPFARWWQERGRHLSMPARDRLKFSLTATVLGQLSRRGDLLGYALITARPCE